MVVFWGGGVIGFTVALPPTNTHIVGALDETRLEGQPPPPPPPPNTDSWRHAWLSLSSVETHELTIAEKTHPPHIPKTFKLSSLVVIKASKDEMTCHTWDHWRFGSGTRWADIAHNPVFSHLIGPAVNSLPLARASYEYITLPGAYSREDGV